MPLFETNFQKIYKKAAGRVNLLWLIYSSIDTFTAQQIYQWMIMPIIIYWHIHNKGEFCDAIKICYDWPIYDIPSTCGCGDRFTVDHAMICK